MRIKNDYVSIKSGKKTFQLNNLIFNRYLHTFINNLNISEDFSEDTPKPQYFSKCYIKLNDALTFDATSQIVMQEFDFWLENPIIAETPSVNTSTINYFFKSNNGKVYSTETFAKTDETVYRNQKITAIGFFTSNSDFADAILDVSNYDMYYDEGFSVARRDTIQTDAIFVSDGKIKTPKHLIFQNDYIKSIVKSIGLGYSPYEIKEKYDVIVDDYSLPYEDNQFISFNNNNLSIPNFKSKCLSYLSPYTYLPIYPTRNSFNYLMFIYKTLDYNGDSIEEGEYWEAIKLDSNNLGRIKPIIKYERG